MHLESERSIAEYNNNNNNKIDQTPKKTLETLRFLILPLANRLNINIKVPERKKGRMSVKVLATKTVQVFSLTQTWPPAEWCGHPIRGDFIA